MQEPIVDRYRERKNGSQRSRDAPGETRHPRRTFCTAEQPTVASEKIRLDRERERKKEFDREILTVLLTGGDVEKRVLYSQSTLSERREGERFNCCLTRPKIASSIVVSKTLFSCLNAGIPAVFTQFPRSLVFFPFSR